jgi:hypothetical protein
MKPEFAATPKKGAARCPRFDSCNAPICPLDNWQRARHLRGEAVCLWLREAVKPGGLARTAAAAAADIAEIVAGALPAIRASSSDIRHKLTAASHFGSKLANMGAARERLRRPAASASGNTSIPSSSRMSGGLRVGPEGADERR